MATIKPVNFPQVAREVAQQPPPRDKVQGKAQRVQALPQKPAHATAARAKLNEANSNKQQTLDAAIAVLQQKTMQLYGPKRTEVRTAPPLGQIIDLKV